RLGGVCSAGAAGAGFGARGRAGGHDPAGHDPAGYVARAAEVTVADARRMIPAVERLLASEPFQPLLDGYPRALVLRVLQEELAAVRSALAGGGGAPEPAADAA